MSIFSKIEKTHVKSNIFDLTHDRKMSGKMGKLLPIMVIDCVPGDKISIKSNVFVRFAPLIAPVMHRVKTYCHFYFVPNRLVWPNWEKFITGGEDGMDQTVHPYLKASSKSGAWPASGLGDYLGLPTTNDTAHNTEIEVNAIPFAAYQLIWNEYYRDQNLQENIKDDIMLEDGDNGLQSQFITLRERAWQHDYFTSALPWTQKGPEAMLPLGQTAPVKAKDFGDLDINPQQLNRTDTGAPAGLLPGDNFGVSASQFNNTDGVDNFNAYLDLKDSHYTDLTAATSSSINDLRRAFKLQEWLEKNARGGSRYIESIAVHFGVQSSDKRLQRPEFLGGTQVPVKISEVLQMSESRETPQGNMSGHGVSIGSGDYVSHFCEEHGYIIGIMSIMPMSAYQQGIPKHFLRRDKFDYYWPEFAHIGEQAIQNQELYIGPDEEHLTDTFGYTPRYVEYKFINNSVHGDFRNSLDFWHMGRKFDSAPVLNEDFIKMDDTEVDRIFAVQDESDNMWCHVLNEVKAQRKMPYFGTPKM